MCVRLIDRLRLLRLDYLAWRVCGTPRRRAIVHAARWAFSVASLLSVIFFPTSILFAASASAQDAKVPPPIIAANGETLVNILPNGEVDISWAEVDYAATSQPHDAAWAVAVALRCAREVIACHGTAAR